jgi:hypothetical protein
LADIERWHFAVGGLDTQQEKLEIGGPISLRRLRGFPTHEQLALSLTSLPVAGGMALYGEKVIRHELVIDAARFEDNTERIFPTASAILAGLRIRTGAEVVCPAVCERSWADLRTNPPNQCRAFHVERGLSHQAAAEPRLLLADDLEWVRNNLATVIRLTEDESFQTAVEALCTYMLAANDRMKVAQLWAGIEAIFDVQHELTFRISSLAARLVEPRGPACRDFYKRMKKLYGERSKAVHGSRLPEAVLRSHITEVRAILAKLLTTAIARGGIPSADDFDDLLFLPDPQ